MTSPSQNAIDCMRFIADRDRVGQREHRASMDRSDMTALQWLAELKAELADGLQYANKAGDVIERMLSEARQEAYARGRRDAIAELPPAVTQMLRLRG